MTEAEKEVEANKLINLIDDMHRKGFSTLQVSPAECFDSLNLDYCNSAVLFLITCTNLNNLEKHKSCCDKKQDNSTHLSMLLCLSNERY